MWHFIGNMIFFWHSSQIALAKTLKDGLCPESHRHEQLIKNILEAVWRAIERDHNHAKFGRAAH